MQLQNLELSLSLSHVCILCKHSCHVQRHVSPLRAAFRITCRAHDDARDWLLIWAECSNLVCVLRLCEAYLDTTLPSISVSTQVNSVKTGGVKQRAALAQNVQLQIRIRTSS